MTWLVPALMALGQDCAVTLGWNPSPSEITGYNIYRGLASQAYDTILPVGNVTNATVSGLTPGTTYFFAVTAVCSDLESTFSNEISYTTPNANTPPMISAVADQIVEVNESMPPTAFTVSDAETAASSLAVVASSSNLLLVPEGNISLGGTDANRTVAVTPAPGQVGTATITLTVSDGSLSASTSFLLTVNPLPAIALTSPVDGTTYRAPATINLAATVTPNGHSIVAVQFYNGTLLLSETSLAPYTYDWANVGEGSYALSARALYDAGKAINSGAKTVTVSAPPGMPAPWQTADIGAITAGSATSSNGTYIVCGAGTIGDKSDKFRYVYQALSADGEIRVQITSAQNTATNARVGVMIREALIENSRHAFVGISPDGTSLSLRRTTTAGKTSSKSGRVLTLPNAYVRLVRSGKTISSYASSDGKTWTLLESGTVSMAPNISIGLAVASGTTSTLNTATFTGVTVVP